MNVRKQSFIFAIDFLMKKVNFQSFLYPKFTLFTSLIKNHLNREHRLPHRKISGIVSGNQYVSLHFYNHLVFMIKVTKGYIWPFYLLKSFMTQHLFYSSLLIFGQINNIRFTEGR